VCRNEFLCGGASVCGDDFGLAVQDIIRALVGRKRLAIAGSQVLQQLHSGAGRRPQRCYPQVRSEYVVEVLLLSTVIFAFAGYAHSQQVAVELQTRIRIGYHDRGVIDTQEQLLRTAMPFLRAFVGGKSEDFQRMSVGIFEVESTYARSILIPIRKTLRAWPENGPAGG